MNAYYCIRIAVQNPSDFRDLIKVRNLDIDKHSVHEDDKKRFSVVAFVSQNQLTELETSGYQIEILGKMTGSAMDPRPLVSQTDRYKDELKKLQKQKE